MWQGLGDQGRQLQRCSCQFELCSTVEAPTLNSCSWRSGSCPMLWEVRPKAAAISWTTLRWGLGMGGSRCRCAVDSTNATITRSTCIEGSVPSGSHVQAGSVAGTVPRTKTVYGSST